MYAYNNFLLTPLTVCLRSSVTVVLVYYVSKSTSIQQITREFNDKFSHIRTIDYSKNLPMGLHYVTASLSAKEESATPKAWMIVSGALRCM